LIAAITAFVSRQIIRRKRPVALALRAARAVHWAQSQHRHAIDLGEDRRNVLEIAIDRLQQHATPDPTHAHFRARHAKFLWQTHRLTLMYTIPGRVSIQGRQATRQKSGPLISKGNFGEFGVHRVSAIIGASPLMLGRLDGNGTTSSETKMPSASVATGSTAPRVPPHSRGWMHILRFFRCPPSVRLFAYLSDCEGPPIAAGRSHRCCGGTRNIHDP
jgi:hypothetical protein